MFCFSSIFSANAQANKNKVDSVIKASYRGFRVDIDLATLASNLINNGEKYGYEAGVYVDLKHKYFPALEIGYGGADKISTSGMAFSGKGMYTRLGVDFNLIKPKKDKVPINNIFFAGARIAFCPFKYEYSNITIQDNYWNQTITHTAKNEQITSVWFEIVAGMRVEISRNIYMGWTVRNKKLFGQDVTGTLTPWYIPGFGLKGEGKNWGVNYSIGYRF
ncbi:MAG: DUF6048 family protein [Paludibacter sp.]